MRVFTGEPGHEYRETLATAADAAAAGGVTSFVLMPDTHARSSTTARSSISSSGARRRPPRSTCCPPAAITKGLRGEEITEFGLLKEAGAVCLTRWAPVDPVRRPAARGDELCRQFRHAHRPPRRRCLAGRRRRDERGPARDDLGPQGHSARGRDHPAGPRPATRRADRRPLPRRADFDRRLGRADGRGQAADRAAVTCRRLDQQSGAQRERRRALPHLLQARRRRCAPKTTGGR